LQSELLRHQGLRIEVYAPFATQLQGIINEDLHKFDKLIYIVLRNNLGLCKCK